MKNISIKRLGAQVAQLAMVASIVTGVNMPRARSQVLDTTTGGGFSLPAPTEAPKNVLPELSKPAFTIPEIPNEPKEANTEEGRATIYYNLSLAEAMSGYKGPASLDSVPTQDTIITAKQIEKQLKEMLVRTHTARPREDYQMEDKNGEVQSVCFFDGRKFQELRPEGYNFFDTNKTPLGTSGLTSQQGLDMEASLPISDLTKKKVIINETKPERKLKTNPTNGSPFITPRGEVIIVETKAETTYSPVWLQGGNRGCLPPAGAGLSITTIVTKPETEIGEFLPVNPPPTPVNPRTHVRYTKNGRSLWLQPVVSGKDSRISGTPNKLPDPPQIPIPQAGASQAPPVNTTLVFADTTLSPSHLKLRNVPWSEPSLENEPSLEQARQELSDIIQAQ